MAPPDRGAYARRNFPALLAVFVAFILLGVLRDNTAALIGGALGIGWLLLALRRGERR